MRDSGGAGRGGGGGSSGSESAAKVERELEKFLREGEGEDNDSVVVGGYSSSPVDIKSSIAMMTGLTAACAGAGWRRALQEVRHLLHAAP